jgi:glycogen(starch) synthase
VRVALVSWEYPPVVVGGLAVAVGGLARALAAAGHDVAVVTPHHGDLPEWTDDATPAGGRLRVVRARTDLPWLPDDDVLARTASANHRLVAAVAAVAGVADGPLGGWRPDVVHAHDWLVAWAADTLRALWGVPLVATIHATEKGRNGGVVHPGTSAGINAVEWWLTYQAREVICCSQAMVREVVDAFTLPPAKVHLVPNGVTASDWAPGPGPAAEPAAKPVEKPVAASAPLVVAWGRAQYEKGFQTLLAALGRLRHEIPGIHAVIAGRGSYLRELQDIAGRLGVDDVVRFTGFLSPAELRALLHRADVAVIPSLYEPFGIVALEALAAEVPVVAAAAGGLVEVLGGSDAAELFVPGDPEGLAAAVHRMLDPSRATAARAAGRALVADRYSWEAVAAATVPVYERAVGS